MLGHEDVIAMIILFNTAKSYKFIPKYKISAKIKNKDFSNGI